MASLRKISIAPVPCSPEKLIFSYFISLYLYLKGTYGGLNVIKNVEPKSELIQRGSHITNNVVSIGRGNGLDRVAPPIRSLTISDWGMDRYSGTAPEQEWLDNYYYPVLPKYGQDGKFIETTDENGNYIPNTYPNNKIPFPTRGAITSETDSNRNLKITITANQIETNVLNDSSGNKNVGCVFTDYKPKFNDRTLKPGKIKNTSPVRLTKINGAF